MLEALYPYYEQELLFLREQSAAFARRYPAAARRLLLESDGSADPSVERLLESFALLTGRVQRKIDDQLPEVTDALLSTLYPHYLAPIPAMSIAQFEINPANAQAEGVTIPRAARLRAKPIDDVACIFRTAYATTLWPLEIVAANVLVPPLPTGWNAPAGTQGALHIRIRCRGEFEFAKLKLNNLRLYLAGENSLSARMYDALFGAALRVDFRGVDQQKIETRELTPADALHPVGFGQDEGLLEYPPHAFAGYRLLTELFAFPEKFWFFDLAGWDRLPSGCRREAEVVVFFDRIDPLLVDNISAANFQLGCTPVVNLFEKVCEPINLNHTHNEYRLVPDARHPAAYSTYSVRRVTRVDRQKSVEYRPLFSGRCDLLPQETAASANPSGKTGANANRRQAAENEHTFWYAARHENAVGENDTVVRIVDLEMMPSELTAGTLSVEAWCANADLPQRLAHTGGPMELQLETPLPVQRGALIKPPTPRLAPPSRRNAFWRLISHLSLNHLSLADGDRGAASLRELLGLYDFTALHGQHRRGAANRLMIEGVGSIESKRKLARLGGPLDGAFCRGLEIKLSVDSEKYNDIGLILFGSVIERFIALYANMNSFTQLTLATQDDDATVRSWPIRAGEVSLV